VIALVLVLVAVATILIFRYCCRSSALSPKSRMDFELSRVATSEEDQQDVEAGGKRKSPVARNGNGSAGLGRYSTDSASLHRSAADDSYELTNSPRAAVGLKNDFESITSHSKATFRSTPAIAAKSFEQAWVKHDQVQVWGATLKGSISDQDFIDLLKPGHVHCLASGQVAGVQKFYLYAQYLERGPQKGCLSMAEVSIATDTLRVSCVFKDSAGHVDSPAIEYIKESICRLAATDE
jgi:hypothetical protein